MEFDCANIFAQLTKRWLTALFVFDLFIWRSKLHLTPFIRTLRSIYIQYTHFNLTQMKRTALYVLTLVLFYSCTPQDAPNTFTDSRDGKVYTTVTIGDQVWLAEGLAYLPAVSASATGSLIDPHYYVYGYEGTDVTAAKATDNYSTHGVLYNWPAAMTACPEGWHLPTDAEWTQLEEYLIANGNNYDGTSVGNKIAKSMASDTGWSPSNDEGVPGNTDYPTYRNKSGFSALAGGTRNAENNAFEYIGGVIGWWSSTESGVTAWYRILYFDEIDLYRNDYSGKDNGLSVRCVKD